MKTIENRITAIEDRLSPKKELPTLWTAEIDVDGKVKLSHSSSDTIHLENLEALERFIIDHNIIRWHVLIVELVNRIPQRYR